MFTKGVFSGEGRNKESCFGNFSEFTCKMWISVNMDYSYCYHSNYFIYSKSYTDSELLWNTDYNFIAQNYSVKKLPRIS